MWSLPVTVSAVTVNSSMSDDLKKLFAKKKAILNFAFPKSVISLPTNANKNVICFSSPSSFYSSTITTKHSLSPDSVTTPLSLSFSVFPSSNASSNLLYSKVTFSKFDSFQSINLINLLANSLPIISDDIKKFFG